MPWKKAKALPPPDNSLFEACFRIQREAIKAAGKYIPLIVENVVGAQRWVGRAGWHFGSYYLWGDIPALMPIKLGITHRSDGSTNFHHGTKRPGRKISAGFNNWPKDEKGDYVMPDGTKIGGDWFSDSNSTCRKHGSRSKARKAASAQIAKIPFPLARHIARCFASQ